MRSELTLLRGVRVPLAEIDVQAARSGGPGGQHVNRTESKVVLRFSVANSPSVPESERALLLERLAARLTTRGDLIVHCAVHRERSRNLATGYDRMEELLRQAMVRRKQRRPSRPTKASVQRRLERKGRRSKAKQLRRRPRQDD